MSYCRAYDDEHEVYLFHNIGGFIECCSCKLLSSVRHKQDWSVRFNTRSSAILHLRHHRLAGDKFPAQVEKTLLKELRVVGDVVDGAPLPWAKYKAQRDKAYRKLIKGRGK